MITLATILLAISVVVLVVSAFFLIALINANREVSYLFTKLTREMNAIQAQAPKEQTEQKGGIQAALEEAQTKGNI